MRKLWLAPLIAVAQVLWGLAVYSRLPERVPSHWNVAGQIDGYQPRLVAVLLGPVLTAGLWLLLRGVAYIDPRRQSYSRFRPTQLLIINLLALFVSPLPRLPALYRMQYSSLHKKEPPRCTCLS